MKLLFFITLLANIIFFFLEFNSATPETSSVESSRSKQLNNIVLLSELPGSKQKKNDLKGDSIVTAGLAIGKAKLTPAKKKPVIPDASVTGVQNDSIASLPFNYLAKNQRESMFYGVEIQQFGLSGSSRARLEPQQGREKESILPLASRQSADPDINSNLSDIEKPFPSKKESVDVKAVVVVSPEMKNTLNSSVTEEVSDASLEDSVVDSISSESETKKLKKSTETSLLETDTQKEVKGSLLGTNVDSVVSKQTDTNIKINQEDKFEGQNELDNKLDAVDKNKEPIISSGSSIDSTQLISKQKNVKNSELCYQIGPFSNSNSVKVWRELNKIQAKSLKQFDKENKVISSYLVYFPAAETYAKSKQQVRLFEQKGVTDFWLFRSGELKGITSLGLFVREDRAIMLQKKLKEMGIFAKIMPRSKTENSLFVEIKTKDESFKDNVQISDQQVFSEC